MEDLDLKLHNVSEIELDTRFHKYIEWFWKEFWKEYDQRYKHINKYNKYE